MNQKDPIDWNEVRSRFPLTSNYRYFNTASSGAIAQRTATAMNRFYEDQLHHAAVHSKAWMESKAEAKSYAAALIGASSEHIAFTTDVSVSMNFVADKIDPKTEIVLLRGDFPSVNLPWMTRGFSVTWISKNADNSVSKAAIEEAIGDGNKALAISWVQYSSGFTLDMQWLSALCRNKNTLLLVDATQAVGAIPVDMQKTPVDMLVASCFKWQGGGYGISIYYENPDVGFVREAKSIGWNTLKQFGKDYEQANRHQQARAIEGGHAKYANVAALEHGLREMHEIGLHQIYQRVQELRKYLIGGLKGIKVSFHSPVDLPNQSAIVCIKASQALYDHLNQQDIKCTKREDYIRLSVHYYNNEGDIDFLIDQISAFQSQ